MATGEYVGMLGIFPGAPGDIPALPLVVTITVKFTGAPFVTVTLGALQFAPVGAPEQANVNVPAESRARHGLQIELSGLAGAHRSAQGGSGRAVFSAPLNCPDLL